MDNFLARLCNMTQEAGGVLTLNLSQKEAYDCLVAKFGGSNYLDSHAPHIAKLLRDTRENWAYSIESGYETLLSSRSCAGGGLQDAVYISYAWYNSKKREFNLRCVCSFVNPAAVCNIHIDILDQTQKQIAKYYIARQNTHFAAEPINGVITLGGSAPTQGAMYTVMVTASVIFGSAQRLTTTVTTKQFSIDDLVARSEISHPVKKFSGPDPIQVFYGRFPGHYDKKIDYVYPEADHQSVADMKLDIMGEAHFNSDTESMQKVLKEECIAIMDFQRGAVRYQNLQGFQFLQSSNKGFSWYFDSDWGCSLARESFLASNLSYLSVMLRYQAKSAPGRTQSMLLSSLLADDLNPACRALRKLNLKMGCLARGTLIRMSDGSQKPVEAVCLGDRVLSGPQGQTQSVCNFFTGKECVLVVIETENGCEVAITAQHLVQTSEGLIEARELNAAMEVLTESGLSAIRYLYSIDYNNTVYNLELAGTDKSCLISAGGIFVGEVNTEAPSRAADTAFTTDYTEIYREFQQIDRL